MATSKGTGTKKPTTNKSTAKAPSTAAKKRQSEVLEKDKKRRQVWSIILFAVGILLILFSFLGNVGADEPNLADHIHTFLYGMFGISVFFVGPIVIYIAVLIASNKGNTTVKLVQLLAIVLLVCAAMQILFVGEASGETFAEVIGTAFGLGKDVKGGGVFGLILGFPLMLFGRVAASIIIILIVFVMVMITANISLIDFLRVVSIPFKKAGHGIKNKTEEYKEESRIIREENERLAKEAHLKQPFVDDEEILQEIERAKKFSSIESATNSVHNYKKDETAEEISNQLEESIIENNASESEEVLPEPQMYIDLSSENETSDTLSEPYYPEVNLEKEHKKNAIFEAIDAFNQEENDKMLEMLNNEASVAADSAMPAFSGSMRETVIEAVEDVESLVQPYTLPPIVLLNDIIAERNQAEIDAEIDANAVKLVDTLKSFGVLTKYIGNSRGPTVTRYELQPAPGVKISKITGLVDDIALNLASAGVRIEAPIPNKAAVGIEVPNRQVESVPFRSLVDSEAFGETDSNLGAALGKNISGEIVIADIAKMPHILIAGTTGSGKSVCVNSIIMSILFRSTPDEVRLLMIDPKAVEFMIYNGIPHLLIPVVTDPKKAAGALSWAVTEMLNRYKMFSDNNVRDLASYNALAKKNPEIPPMPQIVIFIDELADLMMASPKEVEDSICRLAQMARAAGMHLVIATQRPSVNVVTGVIKANIPSRIALKVASQVDSRTIIDSAGAEKLLGKGDMLYFPVGAPKPMRVQGCWVSDKEVDRVVSFIKNSFTLDYDESVIDEIDRKTLEMDTGDKNTEASGGDIDFSDDKLEEAIEVVIDAGQASTSYLQRRLKLGYGRAARLIDTMEEMGIVGPFEGSKPRQVIMTKQEWYERKLNQND